MATELQTFDVRTSTREEMVDVTALVRSAVKRRQTERGLAVVFCPHTTAGVTLQENTDPTVRSDLLLTLRRLVPKDSPGFQHGEGNSDAHIKASVVGSQVMIPIDGGKLLLGHWQAIYLCEFDGPRARILQVKVIAG
jgi:secondary thiamine-phosphate synthase enzyme